MTFSDEIGHPTGEVAVRAVGADGVPLADQLSIFAHHSDRLSLQVCNGWVDVSSNLVVDAGRQVIANLIGGRNFNNVTPDKRWVVGKISFGTYDEAPRFTDTSLSPQPLGSNEIEIASGVFKKDLVSVDWPAPFIVRFEGRLETNEGNGQTIRELGLWTNNNTLFARKTLPPIIKSNDFALSILWRIRA
jgi:hypothetical protein